MNESNKLVKKIFLRIIHIIGIFLVLLATGLFGFKSCNDSGTIQQIEEHTTELRKENYQLKLGFNHISRESEKREESYRELQQATNSLEKDKERYRKDLDSIYSELEFANQELDRIRKEAETRSQEAIRDSEEIRREIDSFGEIIESIEKGQVD